jgi:tRNA nucleotidyltransferase/poly(A) polymerase
MNEEIRNRVAKILSEEFGGSQKDKLVEILNSLEFKDDVLSAGGEIYAVGGIVRDAIMGTPSDDLDIVVRGIPYDKLFAILSKYGKATDTSHEKEDGDKDFGSTKFVSGNPKYIQYLASNGVARDIDVMLPRKDAKDPNIKGHKGIKSDVNPMYTIEDDLQRRDITINAIAMDLGGNIISSGTGLEDIKNGVIRAVSEESFIEDPLRMLRAVRFAARYGYDWDQTTINLIKNNVELLSDKKELPRERFLMEFKKMIGKADLAKAVKLLVDLGMFKNIFGVDPKIDDYSKFDKANSVAEFSYMLFDQESPENILKLVVDNISNATEDINYIEALNDYRKNVKGKNLDFIDEINKMAFENGMLPKGEHDVAFKGVEFKDFVVDLITQANGEFVPRNDGRKFGAAKRLAIQALYKGNLVNRENDIKQFLIHSADEWMA